MLDPIYTSGLIKKEGIYFSSKDIEISYPTDGNQGCYQLEDQSFWFKHRANCILEAVRLYHNNGLFFDVGGGNGFVSKVLIEAGYPSVLVEPGIMGCMNAKKRGLEDVVCSTLEDAHFKESSVQSVGVFDVIEHIPNEKQFIEEIHRLLKVGGMVFLTLPAYQSLWSHEDVFAGHCRRYTIKDIEEKLVNAGFQIRYSSYIFSLLPFPVFIFRTLPYYFGFGKQNIDMKKHADDHKARKGIVKGFLNMIWSCEIKAIRKRIRIPVGGSCFLVAEKCFNPIVSTGV